MQVKPSFYNEVLEKSDGVAVYNTRTGKMMRSFGEQAGKIRNVMARNVPFVLKKEMKLEQWLYDREFLIDEKRNELEEMRELEEKQEFDNYLHLVILTTEECNFRCTYCYEAFSRGKMQEDTQDELIRFVDKQMSTRDGLLVSWFGGEPLEGLNVIRRLSPAFMNICKNQKKVYFAGITTNGYLLTEEIVRELKKYHVLEYQITLDGLPEDHDKQRVLKDGSGSAERIVENLRNIKNNIHSNALRITLRTNFTKPMLAHADRFAAFLQDNFLDDSRFGIFWQVAEDYGQVVDESVRKNFCTESDYRKLINEYALKYSNTVFKSAMQPAGSICYAMKRNAFVISADGVIKKCTCDMESDRNRFGRLDGMFDVKKHDQWLTRTVSETMKCYACKKRPVCHYRACQKTNNCPPNLFFSREMLEALTENPVNYMTIMEETTC